MLGVHETAYPRIKPDLTSEELALIYSPTDEEWQFVCRQYRQVQHRAVVVIQLKVLQRLGYFVPLSSLPRVVIDHICTRSGIQAPSRHELVRYDQSGSKSIHRKRIREFVNIRLLDAEGEQWLEQRALEAAKTKQELPDIINVMLEALVQQRYELPGFTYLLRLARRSRAAVNEQIYQALYKHLSKPTLHWLDKLVESKADRLWATLKREPKRPSTREISSFLKHTEELLLLAQDLPHFDDIAVAKRQQMVWEARALDLAKLRQLKPLKRYALIVLLIQSQLRHAVDDVAEIFIKTVRKLENDAKERLVQYQLEHADKVDHLIGQFKTVLTVLDSEENSDTRIKKLDQALAGNLHGLINQCDEQMAYAGQNHYPFMLTFYSSIKRSSLFKCLELLSLKSSSQDESMLRSIAFVQKHRHMHREYLDVPVSEINELALGWLPDKWRNLIFIKSPADPDQSVRFHRKHLELAVFTEVMNELKSGDLYAEQSEEYDDYREHLVSWEQYEQEIVSYGEWVGLSTDAAEFVTSLKQKLSQLTAEVDKKFPENSFVDIDPGGLILRKADRRQPPTVLAEIDRAISLNCKEVSIIDLLAETEQWLNLHKLFGPLSGFEAKLDDPRKRFITTLFCYGCNLGPSQTARSVKGLSRKQVAWLNLRHVTEDRLDKAIVKVINAYNRFVLPRYWGSGKSASADGTKWNIYMQNLLSEYHIRYGGYGGIGYYHVSDQYIALFSHFIPCGVYEAVYILDGIIKNLSDIQPDTLHGDTQAQSVTVFGLAYLLGIDLMPRIRNIKDLVFAKADRHDHYPHLGSLFRHTVDWPLIERHLKDMLRVVVSIKAGKIAPSTILRRLGTSSRKNKLYYAFRELGRVIRTLYLLRYIDDVELRRKIQAATNKSEEFNGFVQWLFFGGDGIIAENIRHEQRKVIKYNHLVANMVILHNMHQMTGILKELQSKGVNLNEEILSGLAPYRKHHINRFGDYTLNLDREVEPLNYKVTFGN